MRSRGNEGEAVARRVLERAGYFVIMNNFSVRGGEIDIVARAPDGCVVFVEVKLRAREPIDHRAVVPRTKLRRMVVAGREYVLQHGGGRVRYDLLLLVRALGADRAQVFWYKDITQQG